MLQGGNTVAAFQTVLQSARRAQSRAVIKKPVFSLNPTPSEKHLSEYYIMTMENVHGEMGSCTPKSITIDKNVKAGLSKDGVRVKDEFTV